MAEISNRKIQSVISSFFVMLYFCSLPAHARYGSGTGEPNDPYLIYTAEQLNAIGAYRGDWDKHFRLMADVDLNTLEGTPFNIIGSDYHHPFTGVFDGNRHTISHLTISSHTFVALFGRLWSGTKIRDLGLVNVNIDGSKYVAGLVGLNEGDIIRCYSTGSIDGKWEMIGGLVGMNNGTVIHSYSICMVNGGETTGGLVGYNGRGKIYCCYSNSIINGSSEVGGLVCFNWLDAVSQCCSTGSVNGVLNVGGLVGYNLKGDVINSYSTCEVSGNENVGGLVGDNGHTIRNCYANGSIRGKTNVGGLVGSNDAEVINSFWDILTSGQTTSVGGTGKMTDEMYISLTFVGWGGWDYEANGVWTIDEGNDYPRLWWENATDYVIEPTPNLIKYAINPSPADRGLHGNTQVVLSWKPGIFTVSHEVYFGTDADTVADANKSSPEYKGAKALGDESYDPGELSWTTTYYWRIDEVNDLNPESPWIGNIWSFSIADFIIVDDFEDYDSDNQVWWTWKDGLGYGTPGSWEILGNNTGSVVGDETTPSYTEETIIHGGKQSMPFWYNNDKQGYAKYSEAEKTLIYPRDWTKESVSELSLWFHGRSDFTGNFIEEPIGVFTINSSGTDIGGERDQFHFAYKSLTGPGSIVARIESIENTHEWAKAGVMIRQSLDEISKNAFVYVTPSNGIAFQTRAEWRQSSVAMNQTEITAPLWLKLERDVAGNFTASYSVNGTAWQTVHNAVPMNISMSSNVYIGLALTAHNSDAISQAVFSNVTITGTVSEQWEHQDIGIVNNDPEPMYVAVANRAGTSAVIYHDDPNAVRIDTWTEWIIPLQTFADQGIDLIDVDRIAIGFGTRGNLTVPGGRGKMYFDDIRIYNR